MGGVFQRTAPMDRETFECPPVDMYWEGVEDWATPQEKETLLVIEMASLQSAVEMVNNVMVA